jgi:hypothetical protein
MLHPRIPVMLAVGSQCMPFPPRALPEKQL